MANSRKTKKTTTRKRKKKTSNWVETLQNPRIKKAWASICLLFCAVLLVSFISYFFTRETDDSWVKDSEPFIWNSDVTVDNWMGRIGAALAYFFISCGFGLGSFAVPIILFFIGAKIIFEEFTLKIWKISSIIIIIMLILSTSLSFLFSDYASGKWDFLGGDFGYYINKWLNGFMGKLGTGILIFFLWIGFFVIQFDLSISIKKWLTKLQNESEKQKEKLKARKGNRLKEKMFEQEEEEEIEDFSTEIDLKPKLAIVKDENEIELKIEKNKAFAQTEKTNQEKQPFEIINTSETEINHNLEIEPVVEEKILTNAQTSINKNDLNLYDPTLDLSKYQYPTIDLLEEHGSSKLQIDPEELERNKNQIIATLGHYNIEIDKIRATVGPTITLYEIVPSPGVRISKIKGLEDDIALSLAALGIRIIAPMPGKGTIGIEVPNKNKATVSVKSLLSSKKFINSNYDLPIALGKTISNEIFISDLAKMPHLLMAGATGQGKSVGLNVILASLIYKKHPSQLKFVMVDPKKVELSVYRKIERHFLAKLPGEEEAIITETSKVVNTLNSLCVEMDNRYNLLKEAQARNINEYNKKFINRKLNPEKGHTYLPYIVLVIDEFADLMMTAGKEVEMPIARLAQLARAVGLHLIIATQRPSVNIITGTIKANFPARIAYKVTSKVDSRTIIDTSGADRLIGRGDMLLAFGSDLIRLQCAFIDTPEVDKIAAFVGEQQGYPDAFLLPEFIGEAEKQVGKVDLNDKDKLFEDAARILVQHQQGSTSLLQRRLKLGYNRAGRLIDQLEAAGIVGPFEGSKAREVLIPDEYALEQFLTEING